MLLRNCLTISKSIGLDVITKLLASGFSCKLTDFNLLIVPPNNFEMNQPLPELAARLATCAAFLGHDSGITHLAAAAGLRGVALWGGTNPDIWRPRGERFQLMSEERSLVHLEVSRVFAAVAELMN